MVGACGKPPNSAARVAPDRDRVGPSDLETSLTQIRDNGARQINDIAPCMPIDRCDDDPLDLGLPLRLSHPNIFCMAIEERTKEELAAVVQLLCETIAGDRSRASPRIDTLKSALAKLDPSAAPVRRNPLPRDS